MIPDSSSLLIDRVLRTVASQAGLRPTYVTGACIGGDQYIATMLLDFDPGARQCIIVPRDTSRVDLDWLERMERQPNVTVSRMGRGTTYRDRNLALLDVDGVPPDRLVAFPLYPESDPRSQRSGTWMTIRLARHRQIRTDHHVLLDTVAVS